MTSSPFGNTSFRNHELSKTSRGCLFVTSFICMLVWQYRVVRPDTWVHLGKASSLALNLHSSSHCPSSSFQCTLFHPGWSACGAWCLGEFCNAFCGISRERTSEKRHSSSSFFQHCRL